MAKDATPQVEAYERLLTAYGPQGWWPADSPFEVMIGAVLVQNTAWNNVRRAMANLREAGRLNASDLASLPVEDLQRLIRPAGFYRVKADRLRNLLDLIVDDYDGSVDQLLAQPTETLRDALLSVIGVGPETADAIVLYAANQPRFVVDAYTRRVVTRHGWLSGDPSYETTQRFFESDLPADAAMFNEYHALLVEVGKRHCRTRPCCDGCPLESMLPATGPVE